MIPAGNGKTEDSGAAASKPFTTQQLSGFVKRTLSVDKWAAPIELDLLNRRVLDTVFKTKEPKIFVVSSLDMREKYVISEGRLA